MNSLDAFNQFTSNKPTESFLTEDAWLPARESISAAKMFCLCFGALILFAVVAAWPILSQFNAGKHFLAAAIVAGIPGGLILLACRASHGKGEARSALGGVLILGVVLVLFAILL
jgi:hypothetical protein